MDFFKLTKYRSLDENVLLVSKELYEIVDDKIHIDELFDRYSARRNITLNLNVERILYLSLLFLFSVGKIKINKNFIMRCE